MSVRKDEVQIKVSFLTDESKEYAKLLKSTDQLVSDLRKAKKNGTDLTDTLRKIAKEGTSAANVNLDNIVPGQLISRAKQLSEALQFIPRSAPEYATLSSELKTINNLLATIRNESRGVADALSETQSGFSQFIQGVAEVFGGLTLSSIFDNIIAGAQKLYQLAIPMDFFAQKTKTVFSDAEQIITDFAAQNALDLGLSEKQFRDLATSVGDLLVPLGFAQDEAAGLASQVTKQAGILSEWQGGLVSTQEAHDILTKAILGEREGLKQLGIQIDEELVKQKLKEKGLDKLTGESLRQAEALVTLEQVTLQSASANENFEKGTDSAVRAQSRMKATIAELTEDLATSLKPAFTTVLNVVADLISFFAGLIRTLLALPKFISDNRVAFIGLAVAIAGLNAKGIATIATSLRMAAVQKAQAIATNAVTIAQRLLNTAFKANPIGLVITAIGALIGLFGVAYKRSETFRASIDAIGKFALELFKIVGESFKAFGSGFSKLLKGDLKGGFTDIAEGLVKSNPISIALTQGKRLKGAFLDGYKQSKLKSEQEKEAKELEKNNPEFKRQGKGNADAYTSGLDEIYDNLRNRGERSATDIAEATKKALELELKAIEVAIAKKQVVVEKDRLDKIASESDYQRRLLELQQEQYQAQLAAYKKFGQDQTLEAVELQKKLLEVQGELAPRERIDLEGIGPARSPGSVQSETAARENAVENVDDLYSQRQRALKEAFRNALVAEEEYQLQSLNLERLKLEAKIRLLEDGNSQELQQKMKLEEQKAQVEDQIADKQAEARRRRSLQEAEDIRSIGSATADLFSIGADLLAQSEKSRKKNTGAIKALQKAEVIIAGILETQRIWANAATLGPIAGPIVGGFQTGIAAARTALAINKIDNTKLRFGGAIKWAKNGLKKLGIFGGKPHSRGGTKGVFEDGTRIEVEQDEMFVVLKKESTGLLRTLSAVNQAGGGVPLMQHGGTMFRDGGLPNINTTPVVGISAGVDLMPLVQQFEKLYKVMARPQTVRANVVYSDIEATRDEIDSLRNDAAL